MAPLRVADRGDDDVGPEAAAVLADPPALLLVAAVAQRQLELVLGVPRLLDLGRVEDAEVLTDDLVGGVALAALGSRVPAGDAALGREHEDRVVGDGLDQQPEALLARAQRLLLLAPTGDVPRDLGEADVPPVARRGRR